MVSGTWCGRGKGDVQYGWVPKRAETLTGTDVVV